jgi:MoaA/NifB/PqqE/SkfB family radical SAM enzyme
MPDLSVAAARERRDYERTASIISGALAVVGSSDLAMRGLTTAVRKTAKTTQQKIIADWLKEYTAPGNPGNALFRNIRHLHPNIRKRFVAGMIANFFMRDPDYTEALLRERGISSPTTILISPSMRCNLRCVGCYAAKYDTEDDLSEEEVESIISQGEEIGTRVYTILGGEPFVYQPLLDIIERHPQSVFLVFTNGTMINDRVADRILELGNVCPTISIEGGRESTDARRGEGTYDRIMAAMDRLRERGIMIAYSATATSHNIDEITSDAFADLMVEKGAFYGWYFIYMPVGREPDLSLMPSPEQRDQLRRGTMHIRQTRPLLVADFWGDGTLTGGCLSAGRKYLHINNKGDVEPCIFAHFATDNIKDKPLLDCLTSPFFRDLRRMQPFGRNLLRPCPLIDHPNVMKRAVERNHAYPTHEGADLMFTELNPSLHAYAAGVRDKLNPIWENEMPWAHKWLETDSEYQRRKQRGGDASQLSDEAGDPLPNELAS